jgi:CheY-like chemotaxis protein
MAFAKPRAETRAVVLSKQNAPASTVDFFHLNRVGIPMLRILVADDVKDCVECLRILLELWGHEVRVAHDGVEAVAIAASFEPQVALLDIKMPRMHGAEAARLIRQQSSKVVIFALSATDRNDPLLVGYEGVFDDQLKKPYHLERLQSLLAQVASERERQQWRTRY